MFNPAIISVSSLPIKWSSNQPVAEPLIESVMISTRTQQGVSLTSRGRVLETITR